MTGFLVLISLTSLLLIFLISETLLNNRKIKRIPLRITVSGTRGKTSIVRTLASVLRAHGIRVLAKTTGSEAMYILPDGSHEIINRKGMTTILEQKRLITKAARLDALCVVTEIMSIHPENHTVETQKLIKPSITVLSNFRADHTDVVGSSTREISELFIRDIFPRSKVIIPEAELNEFIVDGIKKKKANLISAPTGISLELDLPPVSYGKHIPANLDTVIATARYLGIPDDKIRRGILETRLDIGQLEVFRFHQTARKIWFVNAFAANDPVSTGQVMDMTRNQLSSEMTDEPRVIGLIALRSDRGERSRQWVDYLQQSGEKMFKQIFVTGMHSPVFLRKLKNCTRLTSQNPGIITNQILESTHGDIIVFGIANIHGVGAKLIEFWKEEQIL